MATPDYKALDAARKIQQRLNEIEERITKLDIRISEDDNPITGYHHMRQVLLDEQQELRERASYYLPVLLAHIDRLEELTQSLP